jgi:hypothetical protein
VFKAMCIKKDSHIWRFEQLCARKTMSDGFMILEEAAMKSSLETLHYFRKDLELSSNGRRSTIASFVGQMMVLADPW